MACQPRHRSEDPEARERRIARLLEVDPIPSVPAPILKAAHAEPHKVIRGTARALKKRKYHGRGLLHADGEDAFEMSVSPANKERALLINLRGVLLELTMHEPFPRRERDLTAAELKKQKEGALGWIPNQYTFVPSGELRPRLVQGSTPVHGEWTQGDRGQIRSTLRATTQGSK
jgi:hypothetical protein